MAEPEYKLAKICWVDSRGVSASWQHIEHIQVCPHIGHDPAQGCGEMTIPKIAVESIEYDGAVTIPHQGKVS